MYKNQDKFLHLYHYMIIDELSSCEKRLTDTGDTQIMMCCYGYHHPIHVDITNDYYSHEIHISHGFKTNDIIIYKMVKMPNRIDDYFVPWFSLSIQWDTLVPAREELFTTYGQILQYAYIVDENEVELKYFRYFREWGKRFWQRDRIQESGITVMRLFHICSTIIQNTYLRSIINLDWNLIPEVLTPVILKVITQYDNPYRDETDEEIVRILYLIPGTSNHYYKVSFGLFIKSLLFYRWVDTEVGKYVVEVHKPVLLVNNVILEEPFYNLDTGSNLSSTNDSRKSLSKINDSPKSSSDEDM